MIAYEFTNWECPDITALENAVSEYTEQQGTISVRIISSEEMRKLNRDYAGKDEETDVLSFNYTEHGEWNTDNPNSDLQPPTSELGDIVISQERAVSQARAAGTNENTERVLLLIHGTLHIFGFDHQTEEERQEMDAIQRNIIQGIGYTYRDFGWQC